MGRVVIDVREPFEFHMGHVKGALNVPPSELITGSKALRDIPKDAEIIVYCRTGNRSAVAMNILKGQGYTNLTNGINKEQIQAKYGL